MSINACTRLMIFFILQKMLSMKLVTSGLSTNESRKKYDPFPSLRSFYSENLISSTSLLLCDLQYSNSTSYTRYDTSWYLDLVKSQEFRWPRYHAYVCSTIVIYIWKWLCTFFLKPTALGVSWNPLWEIKFLNYSRT